MIQDVLHRYNPWWEERSVKLEGIFDRPSIVHGLVEQLKKPDIVFLTGLRRVGKTTLMKLLIREIIQKEVCEAKNVLYVSLDDYLLRNYSIIEIVEQYRKLHTLSVDEKSYLFFDEIVFKDEYELQVKNLYDSQKVKIYASSSSASLIKTKKAYLTGRNRLIEVLPLDFEEYLVFKRISIRKRDGHLLERYFEDFLQTGGLPEYVIREDGEYLKELVDDIIVKDIAAVHTIRNIDILKDFFLLLMERAGKTVSVNKIANILQLSPDTSRRYFDMFTACYLIHPVKRHGKTNEKLLSPKKIYAADLGIRTFFTGFRDIGSLFENYVYLKIKHLHPRYLKIAGIELDFIIPDRLLLEVKYNKKINVKQFQLFESFEVEHKLILDSIKKLGELERIAGTISSKL